MAIKILKILLIFVLGVLGGLWSQIYLLPYLAGLPQFQNFQFVKMLKDRQMIINPTKETTVTVQENIALQSAVEKAKKVVIAVKTPTQEGKILEGSGLIVTSDGLLVTLADLVPQGLDFYFYVDGQWPAYQILKRDLKNNLALIKTNNNSLSTAGFADSKKTKLGERVFLVGTVFKGKEVKYLVNEGIIKSFNNGFIQTNILENSNISGSPLFDIAGNVVGLAVLDSQGNVSAVPADTIRQFTGL